MTIKFPVCPLCDDEIYSGDEHEEDGLICHYWCIIEKRDKRIAELLEALSDLLKGAE